MMSSFKEHRLINMAALRATKPTRKVTKVENAVVTVPKGKTAMQTVMKTPTTISGAQANKRPVDPNRGIRPKATIHDVGPTGPYSSSADAQKAQDEYYIKYGASSPELEAYITNLKAREKMGPQAYTQNSQSNQEPENQGAPSRSTAAPIKTAPKPLTPEELARKVEQRKKDRLGLKGIDVSQFDEINGKLKQGYKLSGIEDNRAIFINPTTGDKFYSPLNETATRDAVDIANTDFSKEVTDEQKQQEQNFRDQTARQSAANNAASRDAYQSNMGMGGDSGVGQSPQKFSTETYSAVDSTISMLQALSENSSEVSQDVFNAYLPSILNRLQKAQDLRKSIETMDTEEEVNAMVEDRVAPDVAKAELRENQLNARLAEEKRIIEENKQIALEANQLAADSLELDKQIAAARNAEDETRKAAQNMEGEKRLRRSMNAAGVETSPLGIEYLQGKINEAADSLASMRQTNNLTLLKFDTARKQLANDVSRILNETAGLRSQLYANYDDNIFSLDEFLSGSRSKAYEDIKSDLDEMMKEEDKLLTEAGDKISEAGTKAMELQAKAAADSKKDMMSTKDKLGFVQSLRSGINQNKVITQANDVDGFYGAMVAGYNEYTRIISDPKAGKESLNAAGTTLAGSFARILDPGSVVRNEEYERQVYGQSWVNATKGLFEKAARGGTGLTKSDVESMKKVADQIHSAWETRLQQNLQPFILDIQDWNTNYPETPIDFAQVLPVDRLHLPKTTTDTWKSQSGWSASTGEGSAATGFATKGGPAAGWRTDRHNNAIAFAMTKGQPNQFTRALDEAGIPWEEGDPFNSGSSMVTVRVLGDPVEAARTVLSNTNALQGWYLSKTSYKDQLKKFGIQNNEDFKALPEAVQNDIIVSIYKHEVGNGSLVASITGAAPSEPVATYNGITFNDIGDEDDPIVARASSPATGSSSTGLTVKGTSPSGDQLAIRTTKYRNLVTGETIDVPTGPQENYYKSRSDIFRPADAPVNTTKPAPMILGGKQLPS